MTDDEINKNARAWQDAADTLPGDVGIVPLRPVHRLLLARVASAERAATEAQDRSDAMQARAERSEAEVARLTRSMRNVRAAAMRLRKACPDASDDLLRFCEQAGIVSEILRDESRLPAPVATKHDRHIEGWLDVERTQMEVDDD